MNGLNWDEGFSIQLFEQAFSHAWKRRTLSQLQSAFHDAAGVCAVLQREDPVIYEFQDLQPPCAAGGLAFGLSTVFPGRIGGEYYMTQGHFHQIVDTGELYHTLRGCGLLLIENRSGDSRVLAMSPGRSAYVPRGYAHRTINTGAEPLTSLFVFPADAGHDYQSIKGRGFRNLVVERNGVPTVVPNPGWRSFDS